MNANDFEQAVRELRQRQRRFFQCRKDDPDREKAKRLMREQESVVRGVVESVMARRPMGKKVESEREEFFLAVAAMMEKQREWMQNPGYWMMEQSRAAEKVVDRLLSEFDDQQKEEVLRQREELMKRQTKLF